jgi:hypothetical protein
LARALRPDADALALATADRARSFLTRVDPTGRIDACNDAGDVAIAINDSAGVPDHFRMVVNVFACTCPVDVTLAGGSELAVRLKEAFLTTPSSLNPWNLDVNSAPAGCSLTANNLNP